MEQEIASSGMKVRDIIEEVERVARWRGADAHNPFAKMREQRAKELGL